jgi:Raf kinase inhibitor-like YbhB/YbcL family protein
MKPDFHLLAFLGFILLVLVGSGCQTLQTAAPEGAQPMTIQITSTAFTEGNSIPQKYTCDNQDISPPLVWTGIPAGAKSLALIVDDPDAPVGAWVHWVVFDMLPTLNGLPEGIAKTPTVAGIGTQGRTDFGKPGYGGPCPPKGKPHRYFFRLYALDSLLKLPAGAKRSEVDKAMQEHILALGQLIGNYSR